MKNRQQTYNEGIGAGSRIVRENVLGSDAGAGIESPCVVEATRLTDDELCQGCDLTMEQALSIKREHRSPADAQNRTASDGCLNGSRHAGIGIRPSCFQGESASVSVSSIGSMQPADPSFGGSSTQWCPGVEKISVVRPIPWMAGSVCMALFQADQWRGIYTATTTTLGRVGKGTGKISAS